ncbi:hypothetical protein [Pedobacter gandavensis]|uniref:TolB family protein n=1 Tax=Pedobacter gandavensis TaxID=2679963 RepID=UPI00292D8B5D|nr:hypothetical protein [Pedobacter gandavensis]
MKYFKLKNKFFVHVFFFAFLAGCVSKNNEIEVNKLLDFDISPNGQSIVFSWLKENSKATVYQANIDGTEPHEIVHLSDSLSSYLPRYSHDGDKIVLVRRKFGAINSSIWITDANGLKQITDSNSLVVEAIFSHDDVNLYFSKANDYDSYSPLASKAAHGFDIYLFDLFKKESVKVSNLNAYSLYNITDLNNNEMLLSMHHKNDGVFIYRKSKNVFERIVASNGVGNTSGYSNPVVVDSVNIVCSSYYELVDFNTESKTEKQILASTGTHFKIIRFNRKLRKIFFQKRDDSNSIFSVNIDGSDLREIPINIK